MILFRACQVMAAFTVGKECFQKDTVAYAQSPGPSGKWHIRYSQGIKANMTAATTTEGGWLASEGLWPEVTQAWRLPGGQG